VCVCFIFVEEVEDVVLRHGLLTAIGILLNILYELLGRWDCGSL